VFEVRKSSRGFPASVRVLRARRRRDAERAIANEVDRQVSSRVREAAVARYRSRAVLRQRARQLRDEIRAREEAEQIKDEMIATLSHEFRTPLTSLLGFAELLLERQFSADRSRHFVRIIHDETVRLSRLLDEFLDLERMTAGRQPYAFECVDLRNVLSTTVAVLSTARHQIELDLPGNLPRVFADPVRLQQVLLNLFSNAMKYSPEADHVLVGAEARDNAVVLWIKDFGIGIPEASLTKVFGKFCRLDGETGGVGGTGLGLAIVKGIVEAHGGRVWAESKVGQGSTFFVLLPVAESAPVGTANH
jgi:signal transduction histidine kinase